MRPIFLGGVTLPILKMHQNFRIINFFFSIYYFLKFDFLFIFFFFDIIKKEKRKGRRRKDMRRFRVHWSERNTFDWDPSTSLSSGRS